jgi:hypothetical protein
VSSAQSWSFALSHGTTKSLTPKPSLLGQRWQNFFWSCRQMCPQLPRRAFPDNRRDPSRRELFANDNVLYRSPPGLASPQQVWGSLSEMGTICSSGLPTRNAPNDVSWTLARLPVPILGNAPDPCASPIFFRYRQRASTAAQAPPVKSRRSILLKALLKTGAESTVKSIWRSSCSPQLRGLALSTIDIDSPR